MAKGKHGKKHDFLKRVVVLCLVMMVLLTVGAVVLSFLSGMPPDAGALGVLMGGWCGELLLTLLKRKFDVEDAERERARERETAAGDQHATGEDDAL